MKMRLGLLSQGENENETGLQKFTPVNKSCLGFIWLCAVALFGLFLYLTLWSDKPTGIPLIDQFRRPQSQASPGKRSKPRLPSAPTIDP
ncbi:hypothetical protein DYH09_21895 [bacterium CPR1]|nr:hypothetical protein [bacterium CPR1]